MSTQLTNVCFFRESICHIYVIYCLAVEEDPINRPTRSVGGGDQATGRPESGQPCFRMARVKATLPARLTPYRNSRSFRRAPPALPQLGKPVIHRDVLVATRCDVLSFIQAWQSISGQRWELTWKPDRFEGVDAMGR